MAWFVSHAILCHEPIEEPRDSFLIWENLQLIEASDSDLAWDLAEERAAQDATAQGDEFLPDGSPSSTINGRPARWRFVGIRKLIEVSHEGEDGVLRPGDELSWNEFLADTEAEVEAFARGDEVVLRRTERG
jgi:hypothetical protein